MYSSICRIDFWKTLFNWAIRALNVSTWSGDSHESLPRVLLAKSSGARQLRWTRSYSTAARGTVCLKVNDSFEKSLSKRVVRKECRLKRKQTKSGWLQSKCRRLADTYPNCVLCLNKLSLIIWNGQAPFGISFCILFAKAKSVATDFVKHWNMHDV